MEPKDMILDFIKETLLEGKSDKKIMRRPVGRVSEELRQEYKSYKADSRELKDELEIRKKQLEREAERRLQAEFEDIGEELEERHKALWDKIYKELALEDSEEGYSIETRTGEVIEKIKVEPIHKFN